ncbi:MAG: MBL fold metallo-hydrolase, partial [Myxococcota bacterium]
MKYKILTVGPLETNCYILYTDGPECVVVDPGFEAELIKDTLSEIKKSPKYALLTHTHFDHTGALRELKDEFKDMKILLHPMERDMLTG